MGEEFIQLKRDRESGCPILVTGGFGSKDQLLKDATQFAATMEGSV